MGEPTFSIGSASYPLLLACVVIVGGYFAAGYWKARSSLVYFLVQIAVFSAFTGLLISSGIVPYRPDVTLGSEPRRLLMGALDSVWWLASAWVAVGFLRAFVVLGQKPRESKLVQDLLASGIYLAAALAIIAYVFDLPVRGLLATSGALAIIIGLALQSSLGDVFSGLVLNLERPYRVGDSIILDDTVQGTVIETNWRATHILTGTSDVAIVPNSIVAKSKLVNCSSPTKMHGAKLRVRLQPSLTPAAGCALLQEALLGSTRILHTPQASVVVKDVSAEAMEFELGFSVSDISGVDAAQSELFDRIYRAVSASGMRFAPRLPSPNGPAATADAGTGGAAEKLLAGIALFATLSGAETAALAAKMSRKEFKPGDMVTQAGVISQTLCIVSDGVLSATVESDGEVTERLRLTPGSYFGETGLLTGEASIVSIRALTRTVIYEISKDALCPLLLGRPSIADELSETLAELQLRERAPDGGSLRGDTHKARLAARVAESIRHLFSLH
jgi:small-conductance mechanosensitive channel/CRP-like cAMP-binding protein